MARPRASTGDRGYPWHWPSPALFRSGRGASGRDPNLTNGHRLPVSEAQSLVRDDHCTMPWRVLVERGEAGIYVCVERYKGSFTCQIHTHLSQAQIFLNETAGGRQVDEPIFPSVRSACVYNVGPAVLAAVRALPK